MTTLWVVPHTHWDREWYEPHEMFRARLVVMLDRLLKVMVAEPEYRFTLDGQMAALHDYLELRPDASDVVAELVGQKQLSIGPFTILMDEFCCDGETIVRNLEAGIAASRRFGQGAAVGYLPDMFGHAAQMPQILRGFGIGDACLWRGVPQMVDRDAFVWEALDGSTVRVEYLWDGYGNALKLFERLDKLPELTREYVDSRGAWFSGDGVCGMFGTDHMAPRDDLVEIVRRYNGANHAVGLRLATIDEVIASRDHGGTALRALPHVVGELRAASRGNLLPGVLSIRTRLKAAMGQAERLLTTAERMDVAAGGMVREAFFTRGWGLVVESSAHDSVTGCGVDDTADQVETRLKVAAHTARGAIDTCLPWLAGHASIDEIAVFNQSGWQRWVQTEMIVENDTVPSGAQWIRSLPVVLGDERMMTAELIKVVRRIHGQELFGKFIRHWSWDDEGIMFLVADTADGDFDLSEFTSELERRSEQDGERSWRVQTLAPKRSAVIVGGQVVGGGTAAFGATVTAPEQPVCPSGTAGLSNGLVTVHVDVDGLLEVTDPCTGASVRRAVEIVDDGDCGDSYNFGPTASGPVSSPIDVTVERVETGPWRGRSLIRRLYEVPARLADDREERSVETVQLRVDTQVEVRAGEPWCRVQVSVYNTACDHRLRVLVPTVERSVDVSVSGGQYGATVRGRCAEGGWGEVPLPTYPATRFVHAGGVAILLDKLVEYEVVSHMSQDAIALTVVRGVRWMSVNTHPLRDEPAGSQLPVPGAQYLNETVTLDFAIDVACPNWAESAIVEHSDGFRFDPVVTPGSRLVGQSLLEPLQQVLSTHGCVALESLRRKDRRVEARLVNYLPTPQPLRVRAAGTWHVTNLAGDRIDGPVDVWNYLVPASTILTISGAEDADS